MTQSISAWGWAYAVDACDTGPKSHRSRMLTQCTVTMLTACICIASSGHKAVQSCQEVAILITVLAHAHLHRSTSTSSCLACHVTDQPTMSSMLQLTALWQSIYQEMYLMTTLLSQLSCKLMVSVWMCLSSYAFSILARMETTSCFTTQLLLHTSLSHTETS